MDHSLINPVYERLTRGGSGRSARAGGWLGFIAGCMGAVLTAAWMFIQYPDDFFPVILWLNLGLTIVAAGACLLATLLAAAPYAIQALSQDDLAMLRLTHLEPARMLDGYVAAIARRFRAWLRAGLWFPVGAVTVGVISVAVFVPGKCNGLLCGQRTPLSAAISLLLAAMALAVGAVNYARLWRLVIALAAWVAIRWRGRFAVAMLAASGIGLVFLLPAALGVSFLLFLEVRIVTCGGALMLAGLPLILAGPLGRAIRADSTRRLGADGGE